LASWLDWPLSVLMLALICSRVVMGVLLKSGMEGIHSTVHLNIDCLDKKAEYLGPTYLLIG
jgi:hypothetical protein